MPENPPDSLQQPPQDQQKPKHLLFNTLGVIGLMMFILGIGMSVNVLSWTKQAGWASVGFAYSIPLTLFGLLFILLSARKLFKKRKVAGSVTRIILGVVIFFVVLIIGFLVYAFVYLSLM